MKDKKVIALQWWIEKKIKWGELQWNIPLVLVYLLWEFYDILDGRFEARVQLAPIKNEEFILQNNMSIIHKSHMTQPLIHLVKAWFMDEMGWQRLTVLVFYFIFDFQNLKIILFGLKKYRVFFINPNQTRF